MANTIDILTCTHVSFLKYLEDSAPKEQTFKDMFIKFNEKYILLAKEIFQINEFRVEILDKIKSAQQEYKRLLGHGVIKPSVDINDDEENDTIIVLEKTHDKRGRKKAEIKETINIENKTIEFANDNNENENENNVEFENIPKMKSKSVKESKNIKAVNIEAEELVQQVVVEEQSINTNVQVPVQNTVKKNTKTVKKTEPEQELEPEPEQKAELESEPEQKAELEPEQKVNSNVSNVKKTTVKPAKKESVQAKVQEEDQEIVVPVSKPKLARKGSVQVQEKDQEIIVPVSKPKLARKESVQVQEEDQEIVVSVSKPKSNIKESVQVQEEDQEIAVLVAKPTASKKESVVQVQTKAQGQGQAQAQAQEEQEVIVPTVKATLTKKKSGK